MNWLNKPIISTGNDTLAKTLSVLFVAVSIIGITALIAALLEGVDGNKSSTTAWWMGQILLYVQIILAILLSHFQKNAYWWFRRGGIGMDERQEFVRRRILEKSYAAAIILIGVVLFGIIALFALLQEVSLGVIGPYLDELTGYTLFSLFALPSAIAAWQRDS